MISPLNDCTIVIVTFNSESVLGRCLESLRADVDNGVNVVIVDNGSADNTVARARAACPRATVVELGENAGFGSACNVGVARSSTPIVVFVNPDVLLEPGWLYPLRAALQNHPRIALVSATTLSPDVHRPQPVDALEFGGAVPACALAVRKTAFEELGGFDEDIFLYWEDTELSWRALQRGWRVAAHLGSFVRHARGSSSGDRGDIAVHSLRGEIYVHLKATRLPVTVVALAMAATKTLLRSVRRRDLKLCGAWTWNLVHLRATLKSRRAMARERTTPWREFERLRRGHLRRVRSEHRARLAELTDAS